MTYAPQPLLDARAYLAQRTGLPWVSLGIVGSAGHHAAGTSYHIGWSDLETWAYSRQHPRDTKLRTEAASALDIGQWSVDGLVALTAYLVREARAGRLPDVREIIGPAADGRAYRWAAEDGWTPRQRAHGDSHETHTHLSYYRDSEHRSKVEPFRVFFEEDEMAWDEQIEHRPWVSRLWPVYEGGSSAGSTLSAALGFARLSADRGEELLARLAGIEAAVAGQDVAAAVRAELDRHRATLLAEVAEQLDGLEDRLELPDLPPDVAEQVRALLRAELDRLVLAARPAEEDPA